MVALEYRIDLSRLDVIALDKSNKINEFNSIVEVLQELHLNEILNVLFFFLVTIGGFELLLLLYKYSSYFP